MTELHFEKPQADFDSRVVKQSQNKHAKKSFGVDLAFDFSGFGFGKTQTAPALAVAC